MQILKEQNEQGWITAVILDRWCQAKVYDLPSEYGVNGGRVSKLAIGKSDVRLPGNFFDQMDYNYDRGLDFDNLPDGVLSDILGQLESL